MINCYVVHNHNAGKSSCLGSKVRTRSNREPNLVEPVLTVLVHGSGPAPSWVQVRFEVLQRGPKNRTEPNFGSPKNAYRISPIAGKGLGTASFRGVLHGVSQWAKLSLMNANDPVKSPLAKYFIQGCRRTQCSLISDRHQFASGSLI